MKSSVSFVFLLAAITMAAFVSTAFAAEPRELGIYKWIDEKGAAHFTDDLSSLPADIKTEPYDTGTRRAKPSSSGVQHFNANSSNPEGAAEEGKAVMTAEAEILPAGEGYTVETMINGDEAARLLIDTGSSFIVISTAVAQKLGFSNHEDAPRLPVSTAGGMSWVYLVTFKSVNIGGAELKNVEGAVSGMLGRGVDGLLGMSFLREFTYKLDGARRRLTLNSSPPEGEAYGGHDKRWWLSRYMRYAGAIRHFSELERKMGAGASQENDPELKKAKGFTREDMRKLVGYYRGLFYDIDRRASALGVPISWREYP